MFVADRPALDLCPYALWTWPLIRIVRKNLRTHAGFRPGRIRAVAGSDTHTHRHYVRYALSAGAGRHHERHAGHA